MVGLLNALRAGNEARAFTDRVVSPTNIMDAASATRQLLEQGLRDLRALYTPTNGGGVIAAGVPWYVTTFGRDALVAAHQLLMVNPRLARDALPGAFAGAVTGRRTARRGSGSPGRPSLRGSARPG